MKKLFLTVAILLGCNMLSMAQNYQTTDSKVSWNVKAGMNISNWTGDGSDGSKAKVGFKVGAGMEYALDNTWSLQPSLFLTSKGAKGGDGDTKATINQVYLELPVNLQARVPVADKTNILFAAGPYFAYGVGGKISGGASIDGVDYSVSTNTFGKNRFKRFDAGLGLGVSLEMSKVIVGLEGQLGLTKIGDGIMSDGSPKNINFGVTVGYKF
ncbi:porin family protein [uncultured Bacteroides sp.]|uniref:porin family protein n=1 Tax=uncultured Bacteroides sp. TaxID=162156 RepID=UPI002AAC0409|nr:porin family protein [uncultured Bacteroides sp.]